MPRTFSRTHKATVFEFSEDEVLSALRAAFDIPANTNLSIRGVVKGPGMSGDATPERVLHVAQYE